MKFLDFCDRNIEGIVLAIFLIFAFGSIGAGSCFMGANEKQERKMKLVSECLKAGQPAKDCHILLE